MEGIDLYTDRGDWRARLDYIVQTMREVSRQTDPQAMVTAYSRRVRRLQPSDRFLSLSRRGVDPPAFLVVRDLIGDEIDAPDRDVWRDRAGLPRLEGGLLGELIYANDCRYIPDLEVDAGDPARDYLAGYRSLLAVPVFDAGEARNMIIVLRREPDAFERTAIPQIVWTSNLFGWATHNLVLRRELQDMYNLLDREMAIIGDIQRSLLPDDLPEIATLDLAAHYQPARRAGGDYYDFFPIGDDCLGIFIADVSGHGSPAAVHMAITHTLAHTQPQRSVHPGDLLTYVNHHLARRYSLDGGAFVTAFFGVYDPATHSLRYSSAGHPPPRVKRCADGSLFTLDQARSLPMGVLLDTEYQPATVTFSPGDQVIFYTDGLTESFNPHGEMYGVERLDEVIGNCQLTAKGLIDDLLARRDAFAEGREPNDDITLLVARVRT